MMMMMSMKMKTMTMMATTTMTKIFLMSSLCYTDSMGCCWLPSFGLVRRLSPALRRRQLGWPSRGRRQLNQPSGAQSSAARIAKVRAHRPLFPAIRVSLSPMRRRRVSLRPSPAEPFAKG